MTVVRGELDREDIRMAALAIAAADGIGAVSMRKVADAIGVWPTAVYHHVGDKDGLVQLVLDGVLDELVVPDLQLPWDAWLRAFATATRDVLRRFPGVAGHLSEIGNSSRPALLLLDSALGVLLRGGFAPRDAVVVFVDFFGFLLSRIHRDEIVAADVRRTSLRRSLETALGEGGPGEGGPMPHIAACRGPLTELTSDDYFNEGVEALLRGADPLRLR